MEKVTHFLGRTEQGIFCQALFGSTGAFEKTAGAPPFADWETGDSIRDFIRTLTSDMRKKYAYVLVNALGAGEFFGSNINADYFPWNALSHEGDDYGYKTFLRAHAFQHHANKDPERAFGIPVLSLLNQRMKRVELVIQLDREKAKLEGADGIVARIDRGEFPDVSMGCKVPYDVCSICGNHSKTRDDYCAHMRPPEDMRGIWGPNKILSDGRKIYVLNLTPRFFDISFVFIGADKTAKVMAKLASKNNQVCMGPVCGVPFEKTASGIMVQVPVLYNSRGDQIRMEKRASACDGMRGPCSKLCSECSSQATCHAEKLASGFGVKTAKAKRAEIIKSIPTGVFAMRSLPELEKSEPDISKNDLDLLAKKPLSHTLGAVTRVGMVLKPHEFQHLVLKRMGESQLLSQLDREHKVFREVPDTDANAKVGDLDAKLDEAFSVLRAYIKQRTALGGPFMMRMTILGGGSKKSLPTREPIGDALLDKVSAAYNGYRRDAFMKLSQAVEAAMGDSKLRTEILGDDLVNMFSKTASNSMLSLNSVAYMMSAHFQDRGLLCNSADAKVAEALTDEWLLKDHDAA